MNRIKTCGLLSVLTGLILWGAHAAMGSKGVLVTLPAAIILNLAAYLFAGPFVLRMLDARELSMLDNPSLFRMVQRLARKSAVPMPRLFLLPESFPRALSTGRNVDHASIALTAGLLRTLTEEELQGVIAHELQHILRRDTLWTTLVAALAAILSSVAHFALWGLWSPPASSLIQRLTPLTSELAADAAAARITANPFALANALQKMQASPERIHRLRAMVRRLPAAA